MCPSTPLQASTKPLDSGQIHFQRCHCPNATLISWQRSRTNLQLGHDGLLNNKRHKHDNTKRIPWRNGLPDANPYISSSIMTHCFASLFQLPFSGVSISLSQNYALCPLLKASLNNPLWLLPPVIIISIFSFPAVVPIVIVSSPLAPCIAIRAPTPITSVTAVAIPIS